MSLQVEPGPLLLRPTGNGLAGHRATWPEPPRISRADVVALAEGAAIRGRGGAGFPLGRKLASLPHRKRCPVVVNLAEGEPASHKDEALALHHPHLVLDGAAIAAHALGARTVHVVTPEEKPQVRDALERAVAERPPGGPVWQWHVATPGFVAGEGSAVIELIEGRPNLPVTSWQPTSVIGLKGRPTMLSNAETYAQLAALVADSTAYAALGLPDEPGTRLLTIHDGGTTRRVIEVPHGTAWADLLDADDLAGPLLLGGYHGTWLAAGDLSGHTVSAADLAALGASLGAGVVLPARLECPLVTASRVADYLAGESAGRCGPCRNGLPVIADVLAELVTDAPDRSDTATDRNALVDRLHALAGLVDRRGACAHPDGTVRMLRSALLAFADDVEAHVSGGCLLDPHAATLDGARS